MNSSDDDCVYIIRGVQFKVWCDESTLSIDFLICKYNYLLKLQYCI